MPSLNVIATLRTCYSDKFGVPRQSGLAPGAWGVIEFKPAYRRAEAVRGLEEFSHLWLIGQFHLVEEEPTSLTVRPPKLGGNERRGVLATRSPFRPNRLSLTVVKLERVETEGENAPRLFVSGVDLVDGTPLFDIKPYVRYADSIPEARSGFADEPPPRVPVHWDCEPAIPEDVRTVITQSLSLQPQPAYHDDAAREYATEIAGWHVTWIVGEEGARVRSCEPLASESSLSKSLSAARQNLTGWLLMAILETAFAMADTPTKALVPHPKAVKSIHAPGEVDRPEMVPFIVADPTTLPGVVVDETAAELVGEWQYSTHTPPYVGLGYLHDMKAGKGAKSATFTPTLPKAGWYEVRLAHCYNVRRSSKAPITIHHADGDTKVVINQQEEPAHGRLFRTLGTFRFEAGRAGWVRVSNEGTEDNKVVIADAVQFLPVEAPKP